MPIVQNVGDFKCIDYKHWDNSQNTLQNNYGNKELPFTFFFSCNKGTYNKDLNTIILKAL